MTTAASGELLARLGALGAAVNRGALYEAAVAATGAALERPAINVLAVLNAAGGPRRVGEIAAQMQVEGPHVTRHVHRLEQRGMVRTVVDPDDRRARLVEITPVGQQAIDRYLSVVLGWLDSALDGWSEHDRTELFHLAGRLFDDLTAQLARYEQPD
ncbi:MarR family winged helix-turn-helix transcriptional regulator [Dactylosporangium sp. CA-092794]|uniref:MarR family winged helix-turn-helix transcriptional regulator n=1 Tax=Dactylosporangium sp. CA-092794 TaxID=3239929 RepID=UPI003D8F44EF